MTDSPKIKKRGAVAVITHLGRLLVIRRSQHVRAPRAYCFPGGGIEPGETDREAVVREVREELGLDLTPQRRIWTSLTPWGVHLSWWSGKVDPEQICTPCAAEVESYHWLTPAEMSELPGLLESNRHFLAALEQGQIVLD